MPITIEGEKELNTIVLSITKSTMIVVRRQLFANGVSFNEFVSQLCRMLELKDPNAVAVFEAAKARCKELRIQNKDYLPTTAQDLYDWFEEKQ